MPLDIFFIRTVLDGHDVTETAHHEVIEFTLVFQVNRFFAFAHLEQGGLGDIEISLFDDFLHLAIEKGQQQRPDMGSVHIRIGHDDDFFVSYLFDIVFIRAGAGAQRREDILYFLTADNLVETGLLHVENFTFQRKNGLKFPIATLFGGPTGRVPLHQEKLTFLGIARLAVGQFTGQGGVHKGAFAARQITGPFGGIPGPGGINPLGYNFSRHSGIFFEKGRQFIVDQGLHQPLDFTVAQFGLGLSFKLGRFDSDADNGRQSLAHVVPGNLGLQIFGKIAVGRILVDGSRQGGLEPN